MGGADFYSITSSRVGDEGSGDLLATWHIHMESNSADSVDISLLTSPEIYGAVVKPNDVGSQFFKSLLMLADVV